eukprot:5152146-Pyramimonas_sp.AAC.1
MERVVERAVDEVTRQDAARDRGRSPARSGNRRAPGAPEGPPPDWMWPEVPEPPIEYRLPRDGDENLVASRLREHPHIPPVEARAMEGLASWDTEWRSPGMNPLSSHRASGSKSCMLSKGGGKGQGKMPSLVARFSLQSTMWSSSWMTKWKTVLDKTIYNVDM